MSNVWIVWWFVMLCQTGALIYSTRVGRRLAAQLGPMMRAATRWELTAHRWRVLAQRLIQSPLPWGIEGPWEHTDSEGAVLRIAQVSADPDSVRLTVLWPVDEPRGDESRPYIASVDLESWETRAAAAAALLMAAPAREGDDED